MKKITALQGRNQFEYRIDQTDKSSPYAQAWKSALYLVRTTEPTAFIGISPSGLLAESLSFCHITLYGALRYVCDTGAEVNQHTNPATGRTETRMKLANRFQDVLPFDLMAPVNELCCINPSYYFLIADQDESMREWFFEKYCNRLDPPLVMPASSPLLVPKR